MRLGCQVLALQSRPIEYPMKGISKLQENVENQQNANLSEMGRSEITQGRGKW